MKLPLFPLNIVAFPKERLNLHIFEPRYKQMIQECADTGSHFGVVPTLNKRLLNMGTEMSLLGIEKIYEDGKMDIKTLGKRKFIIHDFEAQSSPKLYPAGEVEYVEDTMSSDILLQRQCLEKLTVLFDLLGMEMPALELGSDFSIYEIGHKMGFNMNQEIDLLKMDNEVERLEFALSHLTELIPVVEQVETMKKRVKMNGHFKELLPPDIQDLIN